LAIFDARRKPIRIAGSFTDITRHRNLEQQLALRAFYDPLTGLPNRAFFMESLTRAFARYERHPQALFAVFFLDLDGLKAINDRMGHRFGDQLLIEFAQRLRSCIRPQDVAARMGGDEFTVLLEDLDDPSEAMEVAARILGELQRPFALEGREAPTIASIGIAFSDCGKSGPDGLLQAADSAMYRAKVQGKGRYEVYRNGTEPEKE
jgi:diguanylate cyclase (GGDEF)-like protein